MCRKLVPKGRGSGCKRSVPKSLSTSGARLIEQQATVGSKTVFRYIFNTYQITHVFRREDMNRLESKNKYFKTNTILNG